MINNNGLIKYTYRIYGLKVISQVQMSELIVMDKGECQQPDVVISYGMVPKEIEGAVTKGGCLKISKKEFYIYIKGVAHYYVVNGNRIIIEPETESNMEEIKIFLLGTCFGILLTQRNTLAIHGGSVIIAGQGIILTGNTGAGKSTLTAAFREKGYNFLADDVSALGTDNKRNCIIYPTYPQQKLCKDAMEKMGYDIKKYSKVDPYREKYALPLDVSFSNVPVPLAGIYEITVVENGKVQIIELTGSEKLRTILRSIYRYEFSSLVGYELIYFKQCLKIAKTIPVYRIVRPKDSFTVKEQMEVVKNSLNKTNKKKLVL